MKKYFVLLLCLFLAGAGHPQIVPKRMNIPNAGVFKHEIILALSVYRLTEPVYIISDDIYGVPIYRFYYRLESGAMCQAWAFIEDVKIFKDEKPVVCFERKTKHYPGQVSNVCIYVPDVHIYENNNGG